MGETLIISLKNPLLLILIHLLFQAVHFVSAVNNTLFAVSNDDLGLL